MKLLLGVLPVVAASAMVAASSTCKRLSDTDSPFVLSISLMLNETNQGAEAQRLAELLEPVDTDYPWLSKCVASIDPLAVVTPMMLSDGYKTCSKSINGFELPETLDDASIRNKLCPFYKDTVTPCTNNVVVQAALDAMTATGTCCDHAKSKIRTMFGTDLKSMVGEMLTRLGSLACAVKTFTTTDGTTATESCGNSLLAAFFSDDDLSSLSSLFQIPTDQVCKAMAGSAFTNTMGKSSQFKWASQGLTSVGICYEPMSAFIKMIGGYPMVSTMTDTANNGSVKIAITDLFTTGKCISSESLFAWLLDPRNPFMTAMQSVDGMMGDKAAASNKTGDEYVNMTTTMQATFTSYKDLLPKMCMRLASGQTCDYGGASITTAFSVEGEDTTTTTEKSLAIKATSVVSSVLVPVLAVVLGL